ncbi:MAG: hypothetical protein AABZ60_09115 [Planctomycetota bacterium]
MRVVTQKIMNQVFEVTDELMMSRETIEIPLGMEGDGQIRKLPNGRIEISLPDPEKLILFLASLEHQLSKFV